MYLYLSHTLSLYLCLSLCVIVYVYAYSDMSKEEIEGHLRDYLGESLFEYTRLVTLSPCAS